MDELFILGYIGVFGGPIFIVALYFLSFHFARDKSRHLTRKINLASPKEIFFFLDQDVTDTPFFALAHYFLALIIRRVEKISKL